MTTLTLSDIEKMLKIMSEVIIKNEVLFCELDSIAGDGDFGMSLAKGFRFLQDQWSDLDRTDIGSFLKSTSLVILENCGGASGPIWGSAFLGASRIAKGKTTITLSDFFEMSNASVLSIQKKGNAQLGDKTLLDALIPATLSLESSIKSNLDFSIALKLAAQAATSGSEHTKTLVAKRGRASYVGERSLNYPDAGAAALAIIFTEIANNFN